MRKIFSALLALLMALPLMAQTQLQDITLHIGDFTKIDVINSLNVEYKCVADSAGMVTFRSDTIGARNFLFTNKKGKLRIESAKVLSEGVSLPKLTVYSNFLSEAVNSGDSTLYINSVAPCPDFNVKQIGNGRIIVDDITATTVKAFLNTGNGTIVVSGNCSTAELKMVGTGVIQADKLRASDVKCKILGGGSIGCWPMYKLNVFGIGSTKIYYRGVPTIKKTGGGKLYQIQTSGSVEEIGN